MTKNKLFSKVYRRIYPKKNLKDEEIVLFENNNIDRIRQI